MFNEPKWKRARKTDGVNRPIGVRRCFTALVGSSIFVHNVPFVDSVSHADFFPEVAKHDPEQLLPVLHILIPHNFLIGMYLPRRCDGLGEMQAILWEVFPSSSSIAVSNVAQSRFTDLKVRGITDTCQLSRWSAQKVDL
jgi:hypothetical protein